MKKIVIAIAIILLILTNTTAHLLLYKKYNDIIDYFNQDSQLTSERLGGLDARVKEMSAKVDEIAAQIDDKTGASQERLAAAFGDMRNGLSLRVESLENDVAAIRQKLGVKTQKR